MNLKAQKASSPEKDKIRGALDILSAPDGRSGKHSHRLRALQEKMKSRLAETLAQYTTRLLITEFMPNGLGRLNPEPNPLPEGYNLDADAFILALRAHFANVETFHYSYPADHSKGILAFCSDRL